MSLADRMDNGDRPKSISNFDGPVTGGSVGLRATAARYALLPLRAFLGITFIYAGLDKLTDPAFFGNGPQSLAAQLGAAHSTAGVPALIDLAQHSPKGFGIAIALGELLVGIGTLIGLWARLAALGGACLSLTFLLTMSWSTTPYYYGNDLPYLMAWTALVCAGAPMYSLDSLLRNHRRRRGQRIFG
ncbi:DoxX family protein [Streptomyces sp. ODS28]|uniref:DoxX family protein n=1 Tax=Streptomyces sp. ODS28 TaxID=3136688 RepID=UPI0031ED1E20